MTSRKGDAWIDAGDGIGFDLNPFSTQAAGLCEIHARVARSVRRYIVAAHDPACALQLGGLCLDVGCNL